MLDNYAESELELMIGKDEKILWRGRPNKKCFILESIFNPLFPFALFWGIIDFSIIGGMVFHEGMKQSASSSWHFIIPFFLIHLMPVWIYLGGVMLTLRKYRHTEYIITDRAVYVSGGILAYTCEVKPFAELSRVNIHRGIFDQLLGVGDVTITGNDTGYNANRSTYSHGSHSYGGMTIADIPDYREVYTIIKKLQTDIYSDTMYPNDLRPAENHGYRTKYKGLE